METRCAVEANLEKRIVKLARDIADAVDSVVPRLLLQIQGTLVSCNAAVICLVTLVSRQSFHRHKCRSLSFGGAPLSDPASLPSNKTEDRRQGVLGNGAPYRLIEYCKGLTIRGISSSIITNTVCFS